ncbi:DUF2290 domain-containing protein [Burkholderia gladioli]|uniref:DUF2290 domain-containing protein n=2 Tax=Burkholderia gladioli TaxID=28095 RepID=UPI00163EBD53|nr:DUF2290 domain-containing protein [Burkholderia gladioli]
MKPPQQPRAVRDDVEQIVSSLIELGIADDQNFPVLRQLSAQEWAVTFGGAEHVSIAMGEIDYEVIHLELSEKRSYNVKLIDGGLLQMMYLFEGERLIKHRLAYYPSPSLRAFQDDPDSYMRDELFLDIVSRRIVPFPLRFDFDQAAAVDVNHPCCHLTLGDVQGCRIPVSSGITPRWFAEFILRNFYQTDSHDFVSRLPAHRLGFDEAITKNEKQLMHVVVPAI